MPRGPNVKVRGVWLRTDGKDIIVEMADEHDTYYEIIRESLDGPISHEATEWGIAARFEDDRFKSKVLNS